MSLPPPLPIQEPPSLPAALPASRPPNRRAPARSVLLKVVVGDMCMAKWEDGNYYLAVIETDVGQDFVTVSFPSNGETKTVHLSQLRPPEEIPKSPALPPTLGASSPSSLSLEADAPKKRERKPKQNIEKVKLPRFQILQEIMNTERSFRDQLSFIMNEFFIPLAEQKIVTVEEQNALLLNLDEIASLSSTLFGLLEEVIIVYQEGITTVGDVFLQFAPNFSVYFQYVAKQNHAKQVLQNLKRNKAWSRFAVEFARSSGSTLESYLSLPLQRIPQYVYFLTQLKQETLETHPDFPLLTKALAVLNEHLSEVNGSIGQQALSELVTKFANPPGLKTLGRWLVCEGRSQVSADESLGVVAQKYHCFLFNDCFAFATYMPSKSKHEYNELRCKIPVDGSFSVKDGGETKILLGRGEQISLTLTLDQVQDKVEWMSAFKNVLNGVKKQEGKEVYLSRTDVNSIMYLAGGETEGDRTLSNMKKKTPAGHVDHIDLGNGASYLGEVKNGKMNGRGIYYYANGDIHDGLFKDDKPHGTGDLLSVNGDRFRGEFVDGKKLGTGVKYCADGDIMECTWVDDIQEGRGVHFNYHQALYDGKWQQGEVVERVDRVFPPETAKYLKKRLRLIDDMRRTVLEVVDGKAKVSSHSFVTLLARCKKHGVVIDILQPEPHELKHWLASATAQLKKLKDDLAQAEAREKATQKIMQLANGDSYAGSLKDGLFYGQGVYTVAAGGKYEGWFHKGKKDGTGTLTEANGTKYTGEFKDDKKNGAGTIWMTNGDKIEGLWVDDALHGRGTLTNKKEEVFDGVWEHGKLVTKVIRQTDDAKDGKMSILSRMFSRRGATRTAKIGEEGTKARVDARLNLVLNPTLDAALLVPGALHFFTKFLAHERSEENIEFWHAVNNFLKNCQWNPVDSAADAQPQEKDALVALSEQCTLITSTYIGAGAARQVNISSALEIDVKKANTIPDMAKRVVEMKTQLAFCQQEIVKLMSTDSFRRFVKSDFWKEFLATGGETIQSGTLSTVHLANGDLYEGEMVEDRFQGLGTYTYTNGDRYNGRFSEGLMHGYGEFSWKSGQKFIGEFFEHQKHGEGVMLEANGDRLEGTWSKGKLHGRGTHYSSTGQVYDAVWANGTLDLKVDRSPQKLLAVFTYPDAKRPGKTKTRLVHCTTTVFGLQMGWKRGKINRQEAQNWRSMEKVEIDLAHPRIELHFKKHSGSVTAEDAKAKMTVQIAPCDPFTVSSHLMTLMDLMERGEQNTTYQSQTTLVRCKILFSRIQVGIRHQKDKHMRLLEIATAVDQLDASLADNEQEKKKCLEEENNIAFQRRVHTEKELKDKKAEKLSEKEQIETGLTPEWQFEVDTNQLLEDFKELGNCQARLAKIMRSYANSSNRGADTDALVRQARASTKKVVQETDHMVAEARKLMEKENLRSPSDSKSDKQSFESDVPLTPSQKGLSPTTSALNFGFSLSPPSSPKTIGKGEDKPHKPSRVPRGSASSKSPFLLPAQEPSVAVEVDPSRLTLSATITPDKDKKPATETERKLGSITGEKRSSGITTSPEGNAPASTNERKVGGTRGSEIFAGDKVANSVSSLEKRPGQPSSFQTIERKNTEKVEKHVVGVTEKKPGEKTASPAEKPVERKIQVGGNPQDKAWRKPGVSPTPGVRSERDSEVTTPKTASKGDRESEVVTPKHPTRDSDITTKYPSKGDRDSEITTPKSDTPKFPVKGERESVKGERDSELTPKLRPSALEKQGSDHDKHKPEPLKTDVETPKAAISKPERESSSGAISKPERESSTGTSISKPERESSSGEKPVVGSPRTQTAALKSAGPPRRPPPVKSPRVAPVPSPADPPPTES